MNLLDFKNPFFDLPSNKSTNQPITTNIYNVNFTDLTDVNKNISNNAKNIFDLNNSLDWTNTRIDANTNNINVLRNNNIFTNDRIDALNFNVNQNQLKNNNTFTSLQNNIFEVDNRLIDLINYSLI
jgi:hypothetical protein